MTRHFAEVSETEATRLNPVSSMENKSSGQLRTVRSSKIFLLQNPSRECHVIFQAELVKNTLSVPSHCLKTGPRDRSDAFHGISRNQEVEDFSFSIGQQIKLPKGGTPHFLGLLPFAGDCKTLMNSRDKPILLYRLSHIVCSSKSKRPGAVFDVASRCQNHNGDFPSR